MENYKNKKLPYIDQNENGVPVLYVDGAPFLMIGGELHNSSASSLTYMEKNVWPYLRDLHLNTVLLPVAWECVEPEEGCYEFSLVEGLLRQARKENVKLVLLWFGLWKNGESFYIPGWMKEDYERFPRARYADGTPSETVTPFCPEAVEKDKRAFCRLMDYLHKEDRDHTVIMIQVENEIGFLKSDRDYGKEAEAYFSGEVPPLAAQLYQVTGTWQEAFGEDAPEIFMAYYYAKVVESIAAAGKNIYALPMYVNAWLEQHPDRPGIYPSGGPAAKLIPLWKAAAPTIDMISPDIYLPDFKDICESYSVKGNPLFIPEARRNAATASNVFYAFGGLNALGFSPFAVEDLLRDYGEQPDKAHLEELNIDADAFYYKETAPYLIRSYQILNEMMPQLIAYRGTDRMTAYIRISPNEKGCIIPMDTYDIQLDYTGGGIGKTGSAGIIFKEKNAFYITGCNTHFKILPKKGSNTFTGLYRYEEGRFENGVWKRERILNGDEVYDMSLKEMAESRYVRVYVHQ